MNSEERISRIRIELSEIDKMAHDLARRAVDIVGYVAGIQYDLDAMVRAEQFPGNQNVLPQRPIGQRLSASSTNDSLGA